MGETQSKESLQRFQLPVTDASSLNQSVRNQPNEPLSDLHAGQLFDKLTRKRVQGPIRERVLKLLHGHPLALTWAGGLLTREDENPNVLADEWEADPTRTLSDPMQSTHTLQWLFGRSVRGLDDTARQALDAAGLLAPVLFPDEAIDAAVGWTPSSVLLGGVISMKPDGRGRPSYVRSALKQLIDRGLLRRDHDRPAWCEFTHDLGYQFARDESSSEVGLREVVATLVGNQDQSFPSFTGSLQAAGQKGTRYELVKDRVARAEARLKFDSTSTEAVVAQATNFLERLEDADITITVSRFANQTNRTVSAGKRPKSMSNSRLLRLDSLPPESSNQKNSLGWAYRY